MAPSAHIKLAGHNEQSGRIGQCLRGSRDPEIIDRNAFMPRVGGIPGPYWFFFYSFDCSEPIHVHVRRDDAEAKFWLRPVALAWNRGFSARELSDIRRTIVVRERQIIEAWHEHCG